MTAKITIRGDAQLMQTFKDINEFDAWATPPIERGTKHLFEIVKVYPKQTAIKTGYVRTLTLQRSIDWNVTGTQNGVIGRVFSSGANQGYGDYEQFVKVEDGQAPLHIGTWATDKDDLDEAEPFIMEQMSKATAEVLR